MNTEITNTKDSPVTRRGAFVTPAVDVFHGESGWLVRADLPGVALEDVNVNVERGRLTIEAFRGDGTAQGAGAAIGGYRRTLLLPEVVDSEKIEAHLTNGVLELSLPKDTRARTRRVAITAG